MSASTGCSFFHGRKDGVSPVPFRGVTLGSFFTADSRGWTQMGFNSLLQYLRASASICGSTFIFISYIDELYHGVKRGARNGIDTSDWFSFHFLPAAKKSRPKDTSAKPTDKKSQIGSEVIALLRVSLLRVSRF